MEAINDVEQHKRICSLVKALRLFFEKLRC
jgi:hypothetical protein